MENLSEFLKNGAIQRGLCAKWQGEWVDDSDQQALIDKYKSGLDFIIKQGEWPTNDFIKANFNIELLHCNLIYVDEHIDLDDASSGTYVLNGACSGVIRFEPWSVATVYVRHGSKVRISAGDFAKIFVRLYDDAEVESDCGRLAFVRVLDRR